MNDVPIPGEFWDDLEEWLERKGYLLRTIEETRRDPWEQRLQISAIYSPVQAERQSARRRRKRA